MSPLPRDYPRFLSGLKERIRAARVKAVLAVNREMIELYWDMGREVVERVRRGRWGTGIIDRLAIDLRKESPGMKGLSASNIWRMRAFYAAWSESALILALPVRELNPAIRLQPVRKSGVSILPEAVSELPWGHNVTILEQLKDPAERLWYAKRALEHGWSRNVLVHQIETGLHLRQGKALTNFQRTLPPPRSESAQEALKDVPLLAQERLYPLPEKLKPIRGHNNRKINKRFDARMHEIARIPCDKRRYLRQVSRAKNRSIALG